MLRFPIFALVVLTLQHKVAVAQSQADINFNDVLEKLEADALEFAREMGTVYENRCNTTLLQQCFRGSYASCVSEFPGTECRRSGVAYLEYYRSICGEFESSQCSALDDFATSGVILPEEIYDENLDPVDEMAVDAICYTGNMADYFVDKMERDTAFWEELGVGPRWFYYGSDTGVFRIFPGRPNSNSECGNYDPRLRPWYDAARSGPKNIVLLLDVSQSMQQGNRLSVMKAAADRLVRTLTYRDRVAIIPFASSPSLIATDDGYMYQASYQNLGTLRGAVEALAVLNEEANYTAAFDEAFAVLEKTINDNYAAECKSSIIFMTDGNGSDGTMDLVNTVVQKMQDVKDMSLFEVSAFTYSITDADFEDSVHDFSKELACKSQVGAWSQIKAEDEVLDGLQSYYIFYALAVSKQEDFVSWAQPYPYAIGGFSGTTVSAPVFARNVEPHVFLGVVGIDITFAALDAALEIFSGYGGSEKTIERFLDTTKPRCITLELDPCALESLRQHGSGGRPYCSNSTACGESDLVKISPELCPGLEDSYPDRTEVWNNRNDFGKSPTEVTCCEVGESGPSDQCPAESGGLYHAIKWGVVGAVVSTCILIVDFMLL